MQPRLCASRLRGAGGSCRKETKNAGIHQLWTAVLLLAVFLVGTGCTRGKEQVQPPTLTVAAASDLVLAFSEIAREFERMTGAKVVLVFGSTGKLAQQIENGAPYDVFAAADIQFIRGLEAKTRVDAATTRHYANGRVGIATTVKGGLAPDNLADLLDPVYKKIAIANPEHAPYGRAAREALESAGLWHQLQDRLVYAGNIQEAFTLVTSGNAEAGLVAISVAANDPQVRFVLVDSAMHRPLIQAMAVVSNSEHPDLAGRFIQYVTSPQGWEVLLRYGFEAPEEGR
ncbi:MAG: molybdate ABC transporter substrate-binding protein [Bacillota bacterium]